MASRFRWTLTNLGDSTSEVLNKDPKGWEQMTLRLSRDKLYHGVFTEFTLALKWHCEGAGKDFIDNVYQTEDVNGVIEVLIEIDCDSSGTYTELYTGRLNLASYQTDGEVTTCNIEKSDLFSKLKARDEISVDLESTTSIGGESITAPTAVDLSMHSQKILLEASMEGDVPFTAVNNHTAQNSLLNQGLISHQLTVVNSEAESFTGWVDYDDFGNPGNTASTSLLPEIFEAIDANVQYPDTYTYNLQFSGTFYDKVNGSQTRITTAHSLVLRYGATLATSTAITLYTTAGYTTSLATYTEAFDTTALTGNITLEYGHKVWLHWFESGTITTGPYNDFWNFEYEYDTAEFSLSIDSTTDSSTAKTMLVHEAFNQVADSIADKDVSFYSEYFGRTDSEKVVYDEDGCGSLLAITNGLNIRQFENKGIFCTLKDLFNSMNAVHNIGLTIEPYDGIYTPEQDVIRVEPISYFYDNTTQTLNLTRPVKVEVINDNSRYINSIQIGFDKWETEFKGGLDEPCTKHEYSTKVNAIKGQYNRLSPYIASGYAIELTRRKRILQTEDWRYDNDNFLISVLRSAYGNFVSEEAGETFLSSFANLLSFPTTYNLSLTPARMLIVHFNQISACLQTIQGDVSFINGEGNILAEGAKFQTGCPNDYASAGGIGDSGNPLGENYSFPYNDLAIDNRVPLWLPEIYRFEYPLTAANLSSVRANPHGYIEVLDDHGNTRKGFILDLEYQLKTGRTKFELLRMYE